MRAARAGTGGERVEPSDGPGAHTPVAPPLAPEPGHRGVVFVGAHPAQAHERVVSLAPVGYLRARSVGAVAERVRPAGLGRITHPVHPAQAAVRVANGGDRRGGQGQSVVGADGLGAGVGRVHPRRSHDALTRERFLPQVSRRAPRLFVHPGRRPGGSHAVVPGVEASVQRRLTGARTRQAADQHGAGRHEPRHHRRR